MKKRIIYIILLFIVICIPIKVLGAQNGFVTKNGKKYYYEDGVMYKGFKEIDGKIYFFSRVDGVLKTGWQHAAEGTWYQNSDGEVLVGKQVIGGKKYYFDDKGIRKTGFIEENGKIYFYSRVNGNLKTGWQYASEGTWYQNSDGEVLVGKQVIDGNKYYFDDKGIRKTGFIEENGKIYFYSRVNGVLKTGWQNADEGTWYQDKNGEVVKGHQTINGNKYYFNANGIMYKGFITLNNKLYFYSRVNGALKTGWQNASEGTWYQNSNGEVLVGKQVIGGKNYYFNEKGIMQKGFVTINNKLYFYSRVNGILKTGWQNADEGTWYQNSNGEVITGKQKISGKNYYFNEKGIMQKGFVNDNNELYFYSRVDGALKTGWQNTNEGTWYQDSTGKVLRGSVNLEDRDYKFNDTTGLLEGFKKENGKTYYYNPDGTKAKGIQYMCGRFYLFNENTGAFEKFASEINVIDVSAHQKDINWSQVKKSGIVDAVILRIGYGQGYTDSYFVKNKNELERLGIPYSVYLFSYAENKEEALKESEFLVKAIKENKVNIYKDLSIFYDLEDWEIKSTGENSYGISKDTYTDMITTFIENTEKNLCIKTRVYASKNYVETRFDPSVQKYATWIAQWNNKLTYKGNYEGWQYTDCLSVPGIKGCVDGSKFYY